MKKLIEWLGMSNRWKHPFGWFTAMYAGVLTAGALEYKDKVHGGRWDWIDFGLTVAGAMIGQLIEGTLIWNN